MPWYERIGISPEGVVSAVLISVALDLLSAVLYAVRGERTRALCGVSPITWVVPVIAVVMGRKAVLIDTGTTAISKLLLILGLTAFHVLCHAGVPFMRARAVRRKEPPRLE